MRDIRRVVVLGANGTMGIGASALFASRGYAVTMLARSSDKAREGLAQVQKSVRSDVIGSRIRCGGYDTDLDAEVAGADLVLEAVAEELDIKRKFFRQVDQARRPGTIVGTVSSGLSMAAMASDGTLDFRRHFLGIHLFNPPQVIVGTELIAGPDTDHEVFHAISSMLEKRLGRCVVHCRDMPGFAGNRVGFQFLNTCARLVEEHGVGAVDYLLGPYTGRAMPPLATIDLVGWDVHAAIVDNVSANTLDEAHASFAMPAYMRQLQEQGHLGSKTPAMGGFYRHAKRGAGSETAVLDANTRSYVTKPSPPRTVPFVEQIKQLHAIGRYRDAMQLFLRAEGPEASLAQRVVLGYVSYALHRVGPNEVVDRPSDIDRIMAFGFNWAPPGVLVGLFGRRDTMAAMQRLGVPTPPVLASSGDDMWTVPSDLSIGRTFVAK